MSLALAEATKGRGKTSPNPAVGAVLVRGARLLTKGYHRKAGSPHAEIEALRRIKNPRGATLYVTLEPCCHLDKRTPPCVDALIQAGLKRVVVGTPDPNPRVSGKGIKKLRRAGIKVDVGVLQQECHELNRSYNYWMKRRQPWVILKAAISLDGKAALASGRSQWITSDAARRRVHQLRSEVDAVLVGIGTALQDNPTLNVRLDRPARQSIRLLWDPDLQISPGAKIASQKNAGPTWIFTSTKKIAGKKADLLRARGVEIIPCPKLPSKKIPAKKILSLLGRRGIRSLLVEGGPGVWTEFLRERVVQELRLFIAPKLFGTEAKDWVGPLGKKALLASPQWNLLEMERLGVDLLLHFQKI